MYHRHFPLTSPLESVSVFQYVSMYARFNLYFSVRICPPSVSAILFLLWREGELMQTVGGNGEEMIPFKLLYTLHIEVQLIAHIILL